MIGQLVGEDADLRLPARGLPDRRGPHLASQCVLAHAHCLEAQERLAGRSRIGLEVEVLGPLPLARDLKHGPFRGPGGVPGPDALLLGPALGHLVGDLQPGRGIALVDVGRGLALGAHPQPNTLLIEPAGLPVHLHLVPEHILLVSDGARDRDARIRKADLPRLRLLVRLGVERERLLQGEGPLLRRLGPQGRRHRQQQGRCNRPHSPHRRSPPE